MSEEEKNELSVRLLREWWLTTTQAFVDNAGSEVALKHLYPYWKIIGMVGADRYYDSERHFENNLKDAVLCTIYYPNMIHEAELVAKVGHQEALVRIEGCATGGACREACICYCQYAGGNCFEEMVRREGLPSGLEWNLTRSLSFGDGSCEFRVKNGETFDSEPLDDISTCQFSAKERLFWQLAGYGEFWVVSAKAFSDWAGPEKAMDVLGHYMRMSGLSIGGRLAKKIGESSSNQETLTNIVSMICRAHQKSSNLEENGVGTVQEICKCPFSDSPKEICEQYQTFFNGICEAIDPSYEFKYDRMMTKGDGTCHWTIKKKGARAEKGLSPSTDQDEMMKKLKWRLTNGEITPEQFRQLRDLLFEK
ncbi:MAG TPA: hypothetical protein VMB46_10180 [Methanomassiliicoccales archaeon]|nr:hypothetical protein [Methanomassiliicoccales archaeon]